MTRFVAKFGYRFAVLLAVAYALFALRGPQGLSAWAEKRRQIRELELQNAEIARENQNRRKLIDNLRHSAAQQELTIRDRLKLVGPHEKNFILRDSGGKSSVP